MQRCSARTLLIHFAGRHNHSNVNMSEREAGHCACAAGAPRHLVVRKHKKLQQCRAFRRFYSGWWSGAINYCDIVSIFRRMTTKLPPPQLVRVWSEIWPGDPLTSAWTTNITANCTAFWIKSCYNTTIHHVKTEKLLHAKSVSCASHPMLFRLLMSWLANKHERFVL